MVASTLAGVREFFGLDDDWVRPLPPGWQRRDAVIAVVFLLGAVVELEAMRALGLPRGTWGRPALYAATLVGMLPLVWRRRFPLAVMLLLAAHMFAFGMAQYVVMGNLAMQAAYFFSIFTALAWGRDRRMTMVAASAVVVFMFGWVAVQLSVASGRDALVDAYRNGRGTRDDALFGPGTGAVLTSVMMNVLFFVTAVATGANSWRGARARARAEDQARTIEEQSAQLTERAVVDERLRIARELHDVVAHHVAAIGVQAAAARKLMAKDLSLATTSLTNVETSSRDAVTQMRSLLGTLRTGDGASSGPGRLPPGGGVVSADLAVAASSDGSLATRNERETGVALDATHRRPEPGLDDLPRLVEEVTSPGFDVELRDLIGDVDVPGSVQHSLYRTVQEALANIRRHSTATSASVTVRSGGGEEGAGAARYAEVEILDEGRPRQGTSGSGMGLLGMRERVTAHRGSAEIGPRLTGGYRVRVRLPLPDARGDDGGRS